MLRVYYLDPNAGLIKYVGVKVIQHRIIKALVNSLQLLLLGYGKRSRMVKITHT